MIMGKCKWTMKNNHGSLDDHKTHEQIIDDILADRGIVTPEEKALFLSPDFKTMHDPGKLPDMDKAVARIQAAKVAGEQITIYGDYDVDGITSTSILTLFLKENGYIVDYYIPDRVSEGYGFNEGALESIRNAGTTLMISVDTGISAAKEVEFAKGIGLDIIITDHHECPETLPDAVAVINPKRPDCKYPFKELAGVGVAFKLIHALAIAFDKVETIWRYIDIVAIGTVADIVPLVGENRIIVKNAFETIPKTWNIGLDALLEVCELKDKKITAGTIGFQIGPRLNATGRLGDAKKGVELFTTLDRAVAIDIAKDLDEENKKRQAIEKDIYELAVKKIDQDPNIDQQNVIVVASKGWHKGVVGIVSSKITERYYKPSVVIAIGEDGTATGSARSIEGFSLYEALCQVDELLIKYGGHDMAAGLSLDEHKIDEFRHAINSYANKIIDPDMLVPKMKIDCQLREDQINIPLAEALEALEPYGLGNPTPVFSYKAKVYNARGIGAGGSHLKMQLYTPDRLIDSIGFGMGHLAEVIAKDDTIMVAGNLQKNEWLGKVTPQLGIRDIQVSKEEQAKSDYYLALYKNMPEPTPEALNVFTNTSNNCYISSYEDTLKYMVPSRGDAVAVYRYLKQLSGARTHQATIYAIKRQANQPYMSEYKVLQILDIFAELGLLSYRYHELRAAVEFKIIEGVKSDLASSKKFQQLSAIDKTI